LAAVLADLGATDVASDDAESDDAEGGLIVPEDDDQRRVARGGSSSEGPDESLRNFWRFETAGGGGIETAVETVGFEGTSPVGVLARGIS
jgi:hypothetical protein